MDHLHPTPFPGKTQPLKPKTTQRTTDDASKAAAAKEPLNSRKNRVFGTVRSSNVIVNKTANAKPITKTLTGVLVKQQKWNSSTDISKNNSSEKPNPKPKPKPKPKPMPATLDKRSTNFSEAKLGNVVEPRTPEASPFMIRTAKATAAESTPFHSANDCSKCRFDRLETASYWLGQIKLAESVGKHFVSLAFFRLAFQANAEPIRNLRVELKRYMARHGHLLTHKDWKDVSVGYGIYKDEAAAEWRVSDPGKGVVINGIEKSAFGSDSGEAQKEVEEHQQQLGKQPENTGD